MPFLGGRELRAAFARAEHEGFAFTANNVTEPNVLLGLMDAATKARSDLVVQISGGAAKYAGGGDKLTGLRALCRTVHELAERCPVGVFLNLDHFTVDDMALLREAITDRLVSSLMIDASQHSFDDNVRISREVAELANGSGILVEAELGKIKGVEDEIASDEAFTTDPDEAVEFVRASGADLLAVSVGTQHGVSKGKSLSLRTDLVREIHQRLRDASLEAPLVLHGSSGLLPEQVREVIRLGIRKLNKDTHYQYVYGRTACEYFLEHASSILPPEGVEDDVLNLFADSEWSPDKKRFDPRAVGRLIQERVSEIAAELIAQVGSGGHSIVESQEATDA
ncbi:MAG: class II fructose-bisphosphate aldolase [Candidatus Bipolaricaulota bacterium]|nr:MAG: class II fructose-bisphosphate aldolase [Candidatus Bipolaricaulota bacterium]